jgi:hypothetical protein
MLMKHCNDTIGNRTRDLPACSAVSPRAPLDVDGRIILEWILKNLVGRAWTG